MRGGDKINMNEEAKTIVEGIKKDVIEATIPAVTEKVVNQLMETMAERKGIFAAGNEDKDTNEKKEVAAEYLRKLVNRQDTKALTAGGSTSGVELVPTYISDSVILEAGNFGLTRKYANKWPMQGSNENIPTMSSVSSYRVNEGVKITSAVPTTGDVQMRGKTVGVIIPVSEKLLRNANPNTVTAISTLAARAIAKLEDQWAILGLANGEGVFQHASVSGATLGSGDTTYAKVEAEDLLDAMDVMNEDYVDGRTRWVLSLSVLNILRRLRSSVSTDKQGFLFQGFGGSTPSTIWDLPYDLSSIMPKRGDASQAGKKFMGLVNWDNVIHGDAVTYQMQMSDQATITDTNGSTLINLFEQNMVALKFWGEIDIELANPDKAFAWVKTAAS